MRHECSATMDEVLPPVVHHRSIGPIKCGRVGLVHRNTLNIGAKPAPKHLAISLAAVEVYSSFQALQTPLRCEGFAGIQQMFERLLRARSWPGGCKLDIASVSSSFSTLAAVANCERIERVTAPQ